MSKRDLGNEILAGIQEIQQHNRGQVKLRTAEQNSDVFSDIQQPSAPLKPHTKRPASNPQRKT